MTTPVQQRLRDKRRTPAQVLDMVRSGSWINPGSIGGDAAACMAELAGRLGPGPNQLHDIELWSYGMGYPQPRFAEVDPGERYHCLHQFFFSPWNRRRREEDGVTSWAQWGWTLGTWWHHYRFAAGDPSRRGIDWWFNAASPPNEHGFFNWSYGTNSCDIYRQCSGKIVVEVRSDYPWAEGGRHNTINIDDIDYWVEADCEAYRWPQVVEKEMQPSAEEQRIAAHILGIMGDRDVIQLGIGSLPSACVSAMSDAGLQDLGIHTEMLNYGLLKMIESGQVTNRYKTLDRGRSVWTFAYPVDTEWYYEHVHRNGRLAVYDVDYTNNLQVLSRIDNMIAIDNCMAIDLLGQHCAGFIGRRPISNTGGFLQFVGFCGQSRGGRGIAAITARDKRGQSRIVPFLPEGAAVDLPAQLAHYVCTEYGLVNLRGLNGYERAAALISIAHPDDRARLEQAAHENGLLPPHFPVAMRPAEGGERRYPAYWERRRYKVPANSAVWGCDWDDDVQSGK